MIAAAPIPARDQSRLLVYHRKRQKIEHRRFASLPDYLNPSDLLVLNNSRVFPARLYAKKKSGGTLELLFLRPIDATRWEVLVKGKIVPPVDLILGGGAVGCLIRDLEGRMEIVLDLPKEIDPVPPRSGAPVPLLLGVKGLYDFLERWGEVPLPPYILKRRGGRNRIDPSDRERYQTLYAEQWGSVAAPTAGLHFTEALMAEIQKKGTRIAKVTLHVGLDTFRPIRTEKIDDHKMSREWFHLPADVAVATQATRQKGGRVVAVGTTVTRALESAAQADGTIREAEGETDLFITPGYRFRAVDALITNFHLPKSTLLALVSAFAGCEEIRAVYQEAIRERYRFYSYGDAMLIL